MQAIDLTYLARSIASCLVAALLWLLVGDPACAQPNAPHHTLPTDFVAHRIYVEPVTTDGDTLRFFTDTGGGRLPILLEPARRRLALPIVDTLTAGPRSVPVTTMPDFRAGAPIPAPPRSRLYVLPSSPKARMLNVGDGMLGNSWFAGRVWTLDYPAERLLLHRSLEALSFDPSHTVALGFKTDSTGQRMNHFPSIEATIAGETHAFLFDTGASIVLTDSAQAHRGGPSVQGTSFVTDSLFQQWQTAHPDWPVMENADRAGNGMPAIRVPAVTIAGHTVGPVWFTRRPNRNFHQRMSALMDRRVEGALGGSLFQYFVITVDYPRARAAFARPASSGK